MNRSSRSTVPTEEDLSTKRQKGTADLDGGKARVEPGFRVEVRREARGEAPVVQVEFDRSRTSLETGAADRLLDGARVALSDVGFRMLPRLETRLAVELKAGPIRLPIGDGPEFVIDVPEGCVAACRVEVGLPEGSAGRDPIVRAVDVELSPAVVLPNVVETLVEAQHLFGDPALRELLRAVAAAERSQWRPWVGKLLDLVSIGRTGSDDLGARVRDLSDTIDRRASKGGMSPGIVLLSAIRFRPRRRQGGWELVPSFGGTVRALERLEWPFWDVALPSAILPPLRATLEELASAAPLATGEMRAERIRPLAIARVLRAAITRLQGEVSADLELPAIEVASETGDRTRVGLRTAVPARARLDARMTATFEGDRVDVEAPETVLSFAGHEGRLKTALKASGSVDLEDGAGGIDERVQGRARFELLRGSRLPRLDIEARSAHPLAAGGTSLHVVAKSVELRGGVEVSRIGSRVSGGPTGGGLRFACRLEAPEHEALRRARSTLSACVKKGEIAGSLHRAGRHGWKVAFKGGAQLSCGVDARVMPIPELKIADNRLAARIDAAMRFQGGALVLAEEGERLLRVAPGGSTRMRIERAEALLDGRRLEFPRGTDLTLSWKGFEVSPAGLGEVAVGVAWDLHGKPCLLHGGGRSASLLTDALRRGDLVLHLSPGGRLSFTGESKGLYGVRFFNALLDPTREPGHLLDVFADDDALRHVLSGLELFDPDLARRVSTARDFVHRMRRHLEAEGVKNPGDGIPRRMIARLLSLAIADDDSLAARLEPLVKDVTECRGLDLDAAKELLRGPLKGRRLDYEVDGILRWIDLVTRPTEPLPRAEAVCEEPLVADPRYRGLLAALPSAEEIYEGAGRVPPDRDFLARIAELSPWLTLAQLDHVLGRDTSAWPGGVVRRLSRVREAKRKVARVDEGYGGLAWAAQAPVVASFLGEAVGPIAGIDGRGNSKAGDDREPACLGPRDVAILFQAGLADPWQGVQTQVNNRLLIELVRSRPGEFLRETLVEMGNQVPRILSGVLFAFLHQDQDEMREFVDLAALLEEKLGIPVPRQADFMAGGHRARESYYEALSELSDAIFDQAGPYLARRAWMREVRRPLPGPRSGRRGGETAAIARRAIADADKAGARATGDAATASQRDKAVTAYRKAFEACAVYLGEVPDGFVEPWFKAFWLRNEEALKVLSVVRAWQEDQDDVRHWLAVASGAQVRREEAGLTETVVRTLYAHREDQEAMLADALVRLLIDPDPGRYDFTIVSCMGVVTDGKDGRELEDVYRRLEERRGVRVIRAHTGLFRSLEYNASAIIAAVRRAETPWGYIGYSQGCANALMAESFLYGGTPEQRTLLDRFVARNLLFSAANGSVHGSGGARKFLAAIAEGERFIKHYQSVFSRELSEMVLRAMKAAMDSRVFVNSLGGTYSLTIERARVLHRDGQFVPWVPTSTTRGIVTPDRLPEALEYLWYAHDRQLPGVACDSQVPAEEAVGRATRVRNAWTDALARCDMGSYVQATHHWSPLTAEIEFVTTERDRARAVYQGPKDRHVLPWVDVNARFGRIRVTS